jgi:hypothetical protein
MPIVSLAPRETNTMRKTIFVFGAVLFVGLLGCAGTMKGIIRKDAKRVPYTYTDSRIGTANLEVVMPGGEFYRGRLLIISLDGSQNETDSQRVSSDSGNFDEVEAFAGNSEALLSGDRGNIMKCRFHVTDIIMGLSSGGFGICQTADGSVIDIFF